jgi:hypothetical protein
MWHVRPRQRSGHAARGGRTGWCLQSAVWTLVVRAQTRSRRTEVGAEWTPGAWAMAEAESTADSIALSAAQRELAAAQREIASLRAQQDAQAAMLRDVLSADAMKKQLDDEMHEKIVTERAQRIAAEKALQAERIAAEEALQAVREELENLRRQIEADKLLRDNARAVKAAARLLRSDLAWGFGGWLQHVSANAEVQRLHALHAAIRARLMTRLYGSSFERWHNHASALRRIQHKQWQIQRTRASGSLKRTWVQWAIHLREAALRARLRERTQLLHAALEETEALAECRIRLECIYDERESERAEAMRRVAELAAANEEQQEARRKQREAHLEQLAALRRANARTLEDFATAEGDFRQRELEWRTREAGWRAKQAEWEARQAEWRTERKAKEAEWRATEAEWIAQDKRWRESGMIDRVVGAILWPEQQGRGDLSATATSATHAGLRKRAGPKADVTSGASRSREWYSTAAVASGGDRPNKPTLGGKQPSERTGGMLVARGSERSRRVRKRAAKLGETIREPRVRAGPGGAPSAIGQRHRPHPASIEPVEHTAGAADNGDTLDAADTATGQLTAARGQGMADDETFLAQAASAAAAAKVRLKMIDQPQAELQAEPTEVEPLQVKPTLHGVPATEPELQRVTAQRAAAQRAAAERAEASRVMSPTTSPTAPPRKARQPYDVVPASPSRQQHPHHKGAAAFARAVISSRKNGPSQDM